MRTRLIRLLAVLVSVLALGVALAAPAVASTPRTVCVPVYLTGEGGVASSAPPVTTTVATLSLFGREIASTVGTFTMTGDTTFTGDVVITPKRLKGGTLVATLTGGYTGAFTGFDAEGPVVGTGTLKGASGHLRFFGPLDLATGTFTEKVTGTLCADLSRW